MSLPKGTPFKSRFRKGDVFSLATRSKGLRPVFFHRYSTHGFICFDSFGTLYKCHCIGHWGEYETHVGQRVHTMPAYRTKEAYDEAVDVLSKSGQDTLTQLRKAEREIVVLKERLRWAEIIIGNTTCTSCASGWTCSECRNRKAWIDSGKEEE